MDFFLIDTKHAIAVVFQILHHSHPAEGIVPIFCLTAGLCGDTHIFFLDLAGCGKIEARGDIGRIHAEDVSGSAVQPDIAEVDRLIIHIATEKQSHVIGGIGFVFQRIFRRDKGDIRILITDKVGDPRSHHADHAAIMFLLEAFHIAEPADTVTDRSHRQLDHHIFAGGIVIMGEDRCFVAFFVNDQAETDKKFLHTGHECTGYGIRRIQNDPGIDIGKSHMICLFRVGKKNTDPVIEVKTDPFHGFQHGDLGNLAVNTFLFGLFSRCGRGGCFCGCGCGSIFHRRRSIDPDIQRGLCICGFDSKDGFIVFHSVHSFVFLCVYPV